MSAFYTRSNQLQDYVINNEIQLIHGGSEYFNRCIKLIEESQNTLHLQFYIIEDDLTGQSIIQFLIQAARRGVKVYILADGYASQNFSNATQELLKANNIHFKFFEPLLKSKHFYFGRRLHHKIIVSDTFKAMIGGVNLSDRYNDLPNTPAWLDFAIYLEGPTAQQLCVLCWKTWHGFPSNLGLTPCEEAALPLQMVPRGNIKVKMLRNDWVRGKVQISHTYHRLLRSAQKDIVILSSYFLPGKTIRKLLSKAKTRGVRVRIITAGHSDVQVAKDAERWLYDWLLRKNIELYEYQPRILHGKLGICDQHWFTLGSYNINDISAYASIELNLEVLQGDITHQLITEIESIIQHDCIQITKEIREKNKTPLLQFRQWLSYEFIRIMLYLFTFYLKQRN